MSNENAYIDIIDIECQFCGQQCFVPLTTQAPQFVQVAYQLRNVNILATCKKGVALEQRLFGASWGDMGMEYEVDPNRIANIGAEVLGLLTEPL